MRQGNRGTGGRRSADDKIKYIRMAAIPLVIVVVLIAVILVMDKDPSTREAADSTGTGIYTDDGSQESGESESGTGEIAPDNSQYTTDFSQYELKKDEIPQVNQIISEYFQAKVDKDAAKLYQLFGKAEDDNLEARGQDLENEAVYIEDYEDIVCYTKPGLTEDSYVAYVTYGVKFRRVDTLAPGLMWCYVAKQEDGSYTIRENVVGDEADYVEKQNQSEDVRLLSKQVNERLREAIEGDSLLAGIYKELSNGAVVRTSEEETKEAQDSKVILEDEETQTGDQTENSGQTGAQAESGGTDDAAQAAAGGDNVSGTNGAAEGGNVPGTEGAAGGSNVSGAEGAEGGGSAPSESNASQPQSGQGTAPSGGSSVKIE